MDLREGKILLFGSAGFDLITVVNGFPKPDQKVRSVGFQQCGGGGSGNAAVGLARLSAPVKLISQIGDDQNGLAILQELKDEGVDVSEMVIVPGPTSFTIVVVDQQSETRTCIFHPSPNSTMSPDAVKSSWLDDVRFVHLDGRHTEAAIVLAKMARERGISVMIDAEKDRPFFDDLLPYATHLATNASFPLLHHLTYQKGMERIEGMIALLEKYQLPQVISTNGKHGSDLVRRASSPHTSMEENKQTSTEEQKERAIPELSLQHFKGQNDQWYEVLHCGVWKPSSIVDTTGAGDSFQSGCLYGITSNMSPGGAMSLGSLIASKKLSQLGSRKGLPYKREIIQELELLKQLEL